MYNIAYYEKYIIKLDSKAYNVYKKICIILNINHIIFCDANDTIFAKNIPVFHSYYLRQLHNLTFIITDKYSLDSLDKTVNAKIIVVYDSNTDAEVKYNPNIIQYDVNTDLEKFIEDALSCNMRN